MMWNFKELHDDEGVIVINLYNISYFYKDIEDDKTYLGMSNGTALVVKESVEEIYEMVKWL